MATSSNTASSLVSNLKNINWLTVLSETVSGSDITSFLDSLGSGDWLNDINWDDVLGSLGDSGLFDSFDLGDLFSNIDLGNVQISDIDLGDLLGNLGDLDFGADFNVDQIAGFFGDALNSIGLGDLFGNLDDEYYYLFNQLPIGNFIKDLSGLKLPKDAKPITDVQGIDLLDGLGTVLNLVGANDLLDNYAVKELLRGKSVSEVIKGTRASDLILGLTGADDLLGFLGDDILGGGAGNDLIKGLLGNDVAVGGKGADKIEGGKGKDILFGGDGRDALTGGSGSDRFLLAPETGWDVIQDFSRGRDKLLVSNGIEFGDLELTQRGRNTIVSYQDETLAVLRGVRSSLTAADVITVNQSLG